MKAEEFDKKLKTMLHYDVLSVDEIIENVSQMREAYHQHRVNAISEEDIESHVNSHIGIFDRKVGFRKGIFWFKEQLLK